MSSCRSLVALVIAALLLSGCASGDSAKEIQTLQDQVSKLQQQVKTLEGERDAARKDLELLREQAKEPAVAASPTTTAQGTPSPASSPSIASPAAGAPDVKTINSEWVSNGVFSMRVDKVETVHKWNELGPLIRMDAEAESRFQALREVVDGGTFKVVLVHAQIRNDAKEAQNVGYMRRGIGMEDSTSHWTSVIWLRGEEGTEVHSRDTHMVTGNSTAWDRDAGSGITYHLQGGFPKSAEVPPGGVASGKIAFVVKSWFVPARIFVKAVYSGEKSTELAVSL